MNISLPDTKMVSSKRPSGFIDLKEAWKDRMVLQYNWIDIVLGKMNMSDTSSPRRSGRVRKPVEVYKPTLSQLGKVRRRRKRSGKVNVSVKALKESCL